MNRLILRSAAALLGAVGLCLSAGQASAHVVYGNSLFSDASVIDPVTGVNGVGAAFSSQNRTASSNAGWVGAQSAVTQMDTHNNRFMYFNLAGTATVDFDITATNTNGNGVLNPGYSIFSGFAPNLSHDGSPYSGQTQFATWSPFAGAPAGSSSSSSKWGEYRSNADFTLANDSAQVSTLTYTGLSGSTGTGTTLHGQYTLGPGVYSLIVGGANTDSLTTLLNAAIANNSSGTDYTTARLARTFNVAFSVTPVPLPAAAWLFGSGVVSLIAFARRRRASV